MKLDAVTDGVLSKIDDLGFKQEGAFNLRYNGQPLCHGDTEHIKIRRKEDKQGIDVYISREAQGEQVHIPVVVSASGITDVVYNDFYVEEGANVTIVAGCGSITRSSTSITMAATTAGMMVFMPSMWERMPTLPMRRSIMEKEAAPERGY